MVFCLNFNHAIRYLEQILEATPHKTTDVQPLTSHLKNYLCKMNETCGTLLENQVTFFYGPLHMPEWADQQELIYINSMRTQDVIWKIC